MVKQVAITALFFCIVASCIVDERLTLIRDAKLLDKRKLQTDGYFYRLSYDSVNGFNTHYYTFYLNGIWRHLSNVPGLPDFKSFEMNILNPKKYSNVDDKASWGVFKISKDSIYLQMWFPAAGMPVVKYYGPILSDTKFVIHSSFNPRYGVSKENDTFYFKRSLIKPDSVNPFIPAIPDSLEGKNKRQRRYL